MDATRTRVKLALLAGRHSTIDEASELRTEWLDSALGGVTDLVLAGNPSVHGRVLGAALKGLNLEQMRQEWTAGTIRKGGSANAFKSEIECDIAGSLGLDESALPALVALPPRIDICRSNLLIQPYGTFWNPGLESANALFDGIVGLFGVSNGHAIPLFEDDQLAWRSAVQSRFDVLIEHLHDSSALEGVFVCGDAQVKVMRHHQMNPDKSFTVGDLNKAVRVDSLGSVVDRLMKRGLLVKSRRGYKISPRGKLAQLRS